MTTDTRAYPKRGKGKKLALLHVNIRLPVEVLNFYKQYPSYTQKMREVLTAHISKPPTT